jgi:ParB family chromosome partitioning protein
MTRKALGRGLSALLRETETAAPTASGVEAIPVDQIDPNPFQPRQTFPEASLQELADSIRASGVVQPILVRQIGDRYQLVAGERRLRASKLAGLESVPAVVRELSDRESLELALTENLLREDLNPIDSAHGLKSLQDKYGLTHEEMAQRLGANRSTITNTLRLLRLPPEIQEMISAGGLSPGHARALLSLELMTDQLRAAAFMVKHDLSVRAAEELVTKWTEPPGDRKKKEAPLDPNVRAAVLELERTLGTRVRIVGKGSSGRIEIRYYSETDLSRIYDWILRR